MSVVKNPIYRKFLFTVGCLSTVAAVIGAFLPLLPTTPFVLLAAWCFYRSSPKAHAWLAHQPVLGPALQDWQKNRAISRKTKIIAISAILISVVVTWYTVELKIVKYLVFLFLFCVSVFILTRNEDV